MTAIPQPQPVFVQCDSDCGEQVNKADTINVTRQGQAFDICLPCFLVRLGVAKEKIGVQLAEPETA